MRIPTLRVKSVPLLNVSATTFPGLLFSIHFSHPYQERASFPRQPRRLDSSCARHQFLGRAQWNAVSYFSHIRRIGVKDVQRKEVDLDWVTACGR